MVCHQKQKTCQKQADTGDNEGCGGKADEILSHHTNDTRGNRGYQYQQNKFAVVVMYDPMIAESFVIAPVPVKNLDVSDDIPAHAKELPYHLENIFPVNDKDRRQRTNMQTDVKQQSAVRLHIENILKYGQMAGTADRKKLGNSLYDS